MQIIDVIDEIELAPEALRNQFVYHICMSFIISALGIRTVGGELYVTNIAEVELLWRELSREMQERLGVHPEYTIFVNALELAVGRNWANHYLKRN